MGPETNKISKCCGAYASLEQTNDFYGTNKVCSKCGKDFVEAVDCAECFPQEEATLEYSKKQPPEKLATIIGGLVLNCGNIYNENKQDITRIVGEYIYNNYE